MPASPSDLFAYLDELGIAHATTEHPAIFTVAEGEALKQAMPGGHTKNLLMQDKDGTIVLISAWAQSVLKLNQLHKHIGTRRLSFASAELMQQVLGVTPGSVTAFALLNDTEHRVQFYVDAALLSFSTINFHPLVNTATTAIAAEDLGRFVKATGHKLNVFDFSALD